MDPDLIEWIDREIKRLEYGEVGIIFVIHEGRVQRYKKIVEIKEQKTLDKKDNSDT